MQMGLLIWISFVYLVQTCNNAHVIHVNIVLRILRNSRETFAQNSWPLKRACHRITRRHPRKMIENTTYLSVSRTGRVPRSLHAFNLFCLNCRCWSLVSISVSVIKPPEARRLSAEERTGDSGVRRNVTLQKYTYNVWISTDVD